MKHISKLIILLAFVVSSNAWGADDFHLRCKGTDKTSLHNISVDQNNVTGYIRSGKLKADPKALRLEIHNPTQQNATLLVYSATDPINPTGKAKLFQARPGVYLETTSRNIILWRVYQDPKYKALFTLVNMKTYNLGGIASWTFAYVCAATKNKKVKS